MGRRYVRRSLRLRTAWVNSLGKDAAKAFKDLYRDSRSKLKEIIRSTAETDAENEGKLLKIMQDMKANAESDAGKATKLENQTGLFGKFKSVLDPSAEGADGKTLASGLLKPPGEGEKIPWIAGNSTDGNLLGHLPEDSVVRDGDLITHVKVNGQDVPVDDYLKNVADERSQMFRDAKAAGTFPKSEAGDAMAVGIDRRTGAVYEGFNGRPEDVIQNPHDTIQDRVDAMESTPNKQNYNRDGTPIQYPGTDDPYGHAEVKAANAMLDERQQLGLPTNGSALGEMSFAPQFPYKPNPPGSTCPNCTHILSPAHLVYGARWDYGYGK